MRLTVPIACAALIIFATPVFADFQQIKSRAAFMALVGGKTLTRPLVKLQVMPDGRIAGMGAVWAVTGNWKWQGAYLCRSLSWGGDDLGYNCQEVTSDGNNVRITSDKGAGQSADFQLR
jgi:hypothetical protein